MKKLIAVIIFTLTTNTIASEQREKTEIIQLSAMSPKVEKHKWAWVRMGLKINNKITPVEYEWRDEHITLSTICRNTNANLTYDDCLKAAKAIFGHRCKTNNEPAYCEAFQAINLP